MKSARGEVEDSLALEECQKYKADAHGNGP